MRFLTHCLRLLIYKEVRLQVLREMDSTGSARILQQTVFAMSPQPASCRGDSITCVPEQEKNQDGGTGNPGAARILGGTIKP